MSAGIAATSPALIVDPRAHGAGVAVLDLPVDLVAQLHEPLDAVVAVDDRQDVLLGRRAVEAVLADRDDRRVPGDVGARQVGEQVEGDHLVLEAGLGDDLRARPGGRRRSGG